MACASLAGASDPDEATPLLSTRSSDCFPDHFLGLWQCRDGDLYAGSTIEIGERHWCPLRPKAAVEEGVTYTWITHGDWCELIECSWPGDRRAYELRRGPVGMLEVRMQSRCWTLIRRRRASIEQETRELAMEEGERDLGKQAVATAGMPPVFLCGAGFLFCLCFFMGLWEEEWSVLTSLYVVTQCLCTIGFGDFQVTHDVTKLTLSFLMIFSLVIFAFVANEVGNVVAERHFQYATNRMNAFQEAVLQRFSTSSTPWTPWKNEQDVRQKALVRCKNRILVAASPSVCCLAFGTIFYATYEDCTCSYGFSHKAGCSMDSYETCVKTGGYVKTWVDAFYMSVMTLTTVGIGDFSPMSEVGRGVGIIWMIVGVVSTGHTIRELATFFFHNQHDKIVVEDAMSLGSKASRILDKDCICRVSRDEYRCYVLLKHGIVSRRVLDSIDRTYDEISRGAGNIDFHTLEEDTLKCTTSESARHGHSDSPGEEYA